MCFSSLASYQFIGMRLTNGYFYGENSDVVAILRENSDVVAISTLCNQKLIHF